MNKNEWWAIAVGLGLFVLLYVTQVQPRNQFYGHPPEWWLIVPVVLAFIVYKWDDLFKMAERKAQLEHPERIINGLMGEAGKEFREKYDILTFTEFSRPMLIKGSLYKITMKDNINGDRVLVASALKGADPLFLSVYKVGDTGMVGWQTEKEYLGQMLPKDKPSLIDVLEELPEEAKAGFALRQLEKEESK